LFYIKLIDSYKLMPSWAGSQLKRLINDTVIFLIS
jgi:hypothetical protein